MKYELVAGLETHIELKTKTKIFCGCKVNFGGYPNTRCCPVCIGLPGTLPVLNKKVVEFAIIAGLAVNCEINLISKMDRKNYVYPDLPKAYQISQYDAPLCKNGFIVLSNGRKIRINRIHIEEDAGKLVHKGGGIFIDYNRGGVPLAEIVTEPDFRSLEEVREYIEELQKIMRYIGVSDCKMQEGSMRCDVNVSIRPIGSEKFGVRSEIKNMNSVTFIVKAIESETKRQISILESGGTLTQETLRYIEETGKTEAMRNKENAHDYRYFREPDLPLIKLTSSEIDEIKKNLPELPETKFKRYVNTFKIPEKDALMLVKFKAVSDFFDKASNNSKNPKIISNFILGQIFSTFENEAEKENFNTKISPENLKKLVNLIENNKINMNIAKNILKKMLESGKNIEEFLSHNDLQGIDDDVLKNICLTAIKSNEKAVKDYLAGKEKALKAILGLVMKETKGKANAAESEKILIEILKNYE